jgi:hypothetical protein
MKDIEIVLITCNESMIINALEKRQIGSLPIMAEGGN